MKLGHVVFETCKQTGIQTYIQTYIQTDRQTGMLIAVLECNYQIIYYKFYAVSIQVMTQVCCQHSASEVSGTIVFINQQSNLHYTRVMRCCLDTIIHSRLRHDSNTSLNTLQYMNPVQISAPGQIPTNSGRFPHIKPSTFNSISSFSHITSIPFLAVPCVHPTFQQSTDRTWTQLSRYHTFPCLIIRNDYFV